ncbi:MAG: YqgE/AlgH family protein [Pseudomonadota bacterium]
MGEPSNIPPNAEDGLSGKMLIAMPSMGDPRFEKTLIYMCAHSDDGALGLVVNRQVEEVSQSDLFSQLEIDPAPRIATRPVHYGGPVETGRGFVLHSTDYHLDEATLEVDENVSMTATIDILKALASGDGPRNAMIALGYAGWGGGQLEGELQQNGWLTCDSDDELIFGLNNDAKWEAALAKLGVDPTWLSAEGGSA